MRLPSSVPRYRRKRGKSHAFFIVLLLVMTITITTAGAYFSIIASIHQVEVLSAMVKNPKSLAKEVNRIFDVNGNLIHEFHFGEDRLYVPLKEIPIHMQQAIIAAEDERFYHHPGYDAKAIIRAAIRNLTAGRIEEGGSTITQQLARNVYISDPTKRSFMRKIDELILATELERIYTKDQILEFYLNIVYFGAGAYGVQSAGKKYFGKEDLSKLTIEESTLLAGIVSSPSNFNPYVNMDKALSQRRSVLEKMVSVGYITDSEANRTADTVVTLKPYSISLDSGSSINYFIDYVKEELILRCDLSFDQIQRGGFDIYTTINQDYQRCADNAVSSVLDSAQKRGEFGREKYDKLGVLQPQTALSAIDVDSGAIVAMVGGRDYKNTQFNRTCALRAPGSSFKMIVYSTAMDLGKITPTSLLHSGPFTLGNWKPREWFRGYFGTITVRKAVEQSSNICAIRASLLAGLGNVSTYAKYMCGIGDNGREILSVPSMALGSVEMKPIEMASAGQTISNYGAHIDAWAISEVFDRKKQDIIYSAENNTITRQQLDPGIAYDMIDLLKGVVTRGTGKSARVYGVPCAGKTGTTADFRDGWFVGFTPEISAAVYVGSDTKDVDLSYVRNYGSKYSAVIWKEFIKCVSVGRKISDWQDPGPADFVSKRICKETRLLANKTCPSRVERFRKGFEPTEKCPIDHPQYVEVVICPTTGLLANEYCPEAQLKKFILGTQPTEVCQLHKKPDEKPINNGSKPDNSNGSSHKPIPGNDDNKPPTTSPEQPPTTTPEPTPTPNPQPTPTPKPQPGPKPEPKPVHTAFFVNLSPPSHSCRVGDVVRASSSVIGYSNVGHVSMFANGVMIGSSTAPPWSIVWRPTNKGNFNLLFVLYSTSGSRLSEYSINYTVYP